MRCHLRKRRLIYLNKYERAGIMILLVCYALLFLGGAFVTAGFERFMCGSLTAICALLILLARSRPSIVICDGLVVIRGPLWNRRIELRKVKSWYTERHRVGSFRRLVLLAELRDGNVLNFGPFWGIYSRCEGHSASALETACTELQLEVG